MTGKSYRIVFMPEGKSVFKEYSFSKAKLFVYGMLIFTIFSAALGIAAIYLSKVFYSRHLSILNEEKALLNQELQYLSKKANNLQEDIDELIRKDEDLRIFAGIPKLDDEVWDVGVGGSDGANLDLDPFHEAEEELFNRISINFEKFSRVISLQRVSYEKTLDKLLKNKELTRYTPSIRPVEGGRMTDRFGYRVNPFNGMPGDFHWGIDIAGIEKGTPIYATADGTVVKSTYSHFLGHYVKIDHNSKEFGYSTLYGHLSKRIVKVGDIVRRGEIIGEAGRTGNATGVHLHYEVHKRGEKIDPEKGYYNAEILK